MKVKFNSLAEMEFLQAVQFYEERSTGLGKTFRHAVEKTIELIRQFPNAAPLVRGDVHKRAVQKKFPYSLVYSVEDDAIYIISIMHQKRRPSYWYSRILK